MVTFQNVTQIYNGTGAVALNNLSFTLDTGEFLFITGRSGSGKSTVIRLLMRELQPSMGEINVDGVRLSQISHGDIPAYRRKTGVVFQNFCLLEDQTVYQNVELAQRVLGVPGKNIRRQVTSVLSFLGLERQYRMYPHQLSGGEKQKVCMARAIVNRPGLLLADEPTGNLDPESAKEIMYLLHEINKRGTTVIAVTHNTELVKELEHRVLPLSKQSPRTVSVQEME